MRPEIIRLGGERPSAGIVWTGVVRQRVFHGARNLYTVEAGAVCLTVDAAPDQTVAPGAKVELAVHVAHTWAVQDRG